MASDQNHDLVNKTKKLLQEYGHEVKTTHLYEVFSKLANEASWNVAKAKGTNFAELLISKANQESDVLKATQLCALYNQNRFKELILELLTNRLSLLLNPEIKLSLLTKEEENGFMCDFILENITSNSNENFLNLVKILEDEYVDSSGLNDHVIKHIHSLSRYMDSKEESLNKKTKGSIFICKTKGVHLSPKTRQYSNSVNIELIDTEDIIRICKATDHKMKHKDSIDFNSKNKDSEILSLKDQIYKESPQKVKSDTYLHHDQPIFEKKKK